MRSVVQVLGAIFSRYDYTKGSLCLGAHVSIPCKNQG